jgi:hypothetical protein
MAERGGAAQGEGSFPARGEPNFPTVSTVFPLYIEVVNTVRILLYNIK